MKRLELHEVIYNRIEFLINKSIVQETFERKERFLIVGMCSSAKN